MEENQLAFPPLAAHENSSDDSKASLLAEYRRLVRVELPAAARAGKWILRFDHCFSRVILDALFGGCWYDHLERRRGRSAESQLATEQLTRAITLARGMLAGGDTEVRRLNTQSLAWRGKPAARVEPSELRRWEARGET